MTEVITERYSDYSRTLNGSVAYAAGLPGYPGNFSRDCLIAGIIAAEPQITSSQLHISAVHQAYDSNPVNGSQPGKIHHEIPGVNVHNNGHSTEYNACDTTGLFLIGAENLSHLVDRHDYKDFLSKRYDNLTRAIGYITSHVKDDYLFWERPPAGADHYALRVTYWKDSILPDASGKMEPVYPVFYPQAHFIAARGILSASRILKDQNLANVADKMFQAGIAAAIKPDSYLAYKDAEGELKQASSDELHSLAYIDPEYAGLLPLDAISERASELATPFGYLCTPSKVSQKLSDRYHGDSVWIFEQAMIHHGAKKFNLLAEAEVAASVVDYIGVGQELLQVTPDSTNKLTAIPAGNPKQLWSEAAKDYFSHGSMLSEQQWL